MTLLYFILGAFGRVWFGSDLESKVFGNRVLQTLFMLLLFISIFVSNWNCIVSVIVGVLLSCWMQFQEISRGHGVLIDTGAGEVDLERYKERWYYTLCNKLIPEEYHFGFLYDNVYLLLRYTCPLVIPALLYMKPSFLLLGISVPFIYTFCNKLEEKESWVFNKNIWWWRRAWCLAEMLTGGIIVAGSYSIINGCIY